MKKILTLLIAAGAFISVNAQSTRDEARKVVLGQGKNGSSTNRQGRDIVLGDGNGNNGNYPTYPNSYPNSSVDQINREYDAKIWSIRNNNTLNQAEKDRMIRQLEKDRAKAIRQGQNNGYSNNKKGNNGNHYGWEKGKGNPHKDGGKNKKNKKHDDD